MISIIMVRSFYSWFYCRATDLTTHKRQPGTTHIRSLISYQGFR